MTKIKNGNLYTDTNIVHNYIRGWASFKSNGKFFPNHINRLFTNSPALVALAHIQAFTFILAYCGYLL